MNQTYGYCKISTYKQNIDRQERNIKALYPEALIIKRSSPARRKIDMNEETL